MGGNGTIITSPDGQVWQAEQSNTAAELRAGVQGAGKLVVVGDAGTILLKYLDSDPPSFAVTNFTDLQIVSNSPVTIRGTATDAGQGGNGVAVLLIGAFGILGSADGNGGAAWRISAPLVSGTNTFRFVAQDNAGNSTTNMLRLILQQILPSVVATPTISPTGGNFVQSVRVTLDCETSGATIRYTTDGNDPTSTSPVYDVPFTLTSSATVKAKAFKSGFNESAIASASFIVEPDRAPPIIGFIPNVVTSVNSESDIVSFTVSDLETPAGSLIVQAVASTNPGLAPLSSVQFSANGNAYRMIVIPGRDQIGESTITIRVTDGDGMSAERSFKFTVLKDVRPSLSVLGLNNNMLRYRIEGPPNATVFIQFSSDLVNWSELGSQTVSADGSVLGFDLVSPSQSERFYRAVLR